MVAMGCAALCLIVVDAGAIEFSSPTYGGNGGTPYNLDCGNGAVMVGVQGKAGQWIDSVMVVCQQVKSDGNLGNRFTKGPAGGNGGVVTGQSCREGRVVGSISAGTVMGFVQWMSFNCYGWDPNLRIRTSGGDSSIVLAPSNLSKSRMLLDKNNTTNCPLRLPGVALRGKAGMYVDSVRLICDAVAGSAGMPNATQPPPPSGAPAPLKPGTNLRPIPGVSPNLGQIRPGQIQVPQETPKPLAPPSVLPGTPTAPSTENLRPRIVAMVPRTGPPLTDVTLSGERLQGATVNINIGIRPDGTPTSALPGTVLQSSDSVVRFKVPLLSVGGNVQVVVSNQFGSTVSPFPFSVDVTPVITSVEPNTGTPGTRIKIKGHNLDRAQVVRFGTDAVPGLLVIATPTEIVVDQPNCRGAAQLFVELRQDQGLANQVLSPVPYTCGVLPVISSISPVQSGPGAQISIQGSGFIGVTEVRIPLLGSVPFTLSNQGLILVTVPSYPPVPTLVVDTVRVTTPSGVAVSPQPLALLPAPAVTQVQPQYGDPGMNVHIVGQNLRPSNVAPQVRFNGTQATASFQGDNSGVTVQIPAGATSGPLEVRTINSPVPAPVPFFFFVGTPPPPVVTAIEPPSGPVGSTITIRGENLMTVADVRFTGNVPSGLRTGDHATSVTTTVPVGAQTGPITLRTMLGCQPGVICPQAQLFTTPLSFTVTP